MHGFSPARARSRARTLIAAAAVAGATLLIAGPAVAAAPPDVTAIDPASVTVTTTGGGGTVTQWSTLRIDADWAVPDGATSGDIFMMQLPAELSGVASAFDLPAVDDPTQTVARCVVGGGSAGLLTCTLTDYVDGRTGVSGSLWFLASASTVTTATSLTFIVNGQAVSVDLPGDGGIGSPPPPTTSPLPTAASKSGWQNGATSLGWQIIVPGSAIADLDRVTITDALTPASATVQEHRNVDGALTVQYRTSASNAWTTITTWTGGWDASGTSFSIDLIGPFDGDRAYRVLYSTVPQAALAGDVYANVAVVDGETLRATRVWVVNGGGAGGGVLPGQFAITKVVNGDIDDLPEDLTYTIRYAYGATSEQLQVRADGSQSYSLRVPAGTTITLAEVDLPEVSGITWGTPVFSGEGVIDHGDGSATIAPAAGQVVQLALTNTALASTPTPTPTPTPTSSASPTATPTAVATVASSAGTAPREASKLAVTGGSGPAWVVLLVGIGAIALGAAAGVRAMTARRR